MKSKDIRKQVVEKVYQGQSRQSIFDDFNSRIKGREQDLASIVVDVPTLVQRQRWQWLNIVLIALLSISVLFKVLYVVGLSAEYGPLALLLVLIVPIINVAMLYGVVTYRPRYYRTIGFIGLFSAFQMLSQWRSLEIDAWIIVDLNLVAGLIFLGFFLNRKLKGRYFVKAHQFKDAQGAIRSRSTIRFED